MTLEFHEPAGATPLTPDELLGLKAKHIATRGELNELEGENIITGLTWLDRRSKSFDLLTDAAVREIHKRLFGEVWDWAGVYRLTEKNIGVPVWHISTELATGVTTRALIGWKQLRAFIIAWSGSIPSRTETDVGPESWQTPTWRRSIRISSSTGPAAER